MLGRAVLLHTRRGSRYTTRALATVEKTVGGALGEDGRHEIWREGIYDHDNEPKVSATTKLHYERSTCSTTNCNAESFTSRE